jgi:hypothetical protein
MPSWRATARAPDAVAGEQQAPNRAASFSGAAHGAVRSVIPTTLHPASTSRAAATELSTPPLIPTTVYGILA